MYGTYITASWSSLPGKRLTNRSGCVDAPVCDCPIWEEPNLCMKSAITDYEGSTNHRQESWVLAYDGIEKTTSQLSESIQGKIAEFPVGLADFFEHFLDFRDVNTMNTRLNISHFADQLQGYDGISKLAIEQSTSATQELGHNQLIYGYDEHGSVYNVVESKKSQAFQVWESKNWDVTLSPAVSFWEPPFYNADLDVARC